MKEAYNNKENELSEEINLRELLSVLAQGKKIILYLTSLFSIIGIIYSLLLPNIYKSEALLASIDESSSLMSGALGELGGLAGLAGINLLDEDSDSNSKKAFELMGSLDFFENYIMPNISLPDLFAVKFWDDKKNEIIYDDNIFDINSNSWGRSFSYPQKLIPSAQESFEEFEDHYFDLTEDKKTGYVVLSIKHQSPLIAKQWVEIIVREVNSFYRQKDKTKSEKAVTYLNNQILATGLAEIKKVTATLLQKEIQKLTLIEANPDYVFEYIYPPSIMEKQSEPKRILIISLFFLFGSMLGIIIVLYRHYFLVEKNEEENISI